MEDILSASLTCIRSIHQKLFQEECYNLLIVYKHVKEYTYFDELSKNNQILLVSLVYAGLKQYNPNVTKIFIDEVLANRRNTDVHVLLLILKKLDTFASFGESNLDEKLHWSIYIFSQLKKYRIKECIKDGSRNKNSIVYNRMLARYASQLLESYSFPQQLSVSYLDELFKWRKEASVEEKEEEKCMIACGNCEKKIKIIEIDGKKYYECDSCYYCSII